jgi:hypothetical protein
MPFNANIPQPGHLLSQSQSDILNNFTAIASVINPNTGTLTLTQAAVPTTAANQVSLYNSITNGLNIKVGTDAPIDITTATKASVGQCTLPSGIQLKWGNITVAASTNTITTTFASLGLADFSNNSLIAFSSLQSGWTYNHDARDYLVIISASQTGVTLQRASAYDGAAVTVNWLAIGY